MGERGHRGRGTLESEVLACLAAADGALTPTEVRAEMGESLAYTTIMTVLSRLYDKGALRRTARGRSYAYEIIGGSTGAQASLTAHQMRRALDAGADRSGALSRFVDGLKDDEARLLRELLDLPPHPAGSGEDS
ncbi:MAG: BlaI/MecI/CopY family transcriptional regulator [Nocardioides sp.]|uniref:BlaI/MecI/CopY family transcriptional regulator n=1 Tax=Nocardioides sp. TaxID=35761 RepID=UPI0039E6087D